MIFLIFVFGFLFGVWVWGVVVDKFGCKVNVFGFIFVGIMVFIFFIVLSDLMIGSFNMLVILGLIYNFGFLFLVVWGGYFLELFFVYLCSYGVVFFYGG